MKEESEPPPHYIESARLKIRQPFSKLRRGAANVGVSPDTGRVVHNEEEFAATRAANEELTEKRKALIAA